MNYWYLVVLMWKKNWHVKNHIWRLQKKKNPHMTLSNRNSVTKIKFVQKYLRQSLIILEFKF